MRKFIYTHILKLWCAWVLVIFVLCATPGQYIPSADWLELLSFDKFVHASMFFIFTTLTLLVIVKYRRAGAVFFPGCFLCICYGALLEVMQAYCFSNRSADWKDMLANTFGCLVALLLVKKTGSLMTKPEAHKG